jgi:hypothetical protein
MWSRFWSISSRTALDYSLVGSHKLKWTWIGDLRIVNL